jgi:hypothetical protein
MSLYHELEKYEEADPFKYTVEAIDDLVIECIDLLGDVDEIKIGEIEDLLFNLKFKLKTISKKLV